MRIDYQCADLLCLLKGSIPIPSFSTYPNLPATTWVSRATNSFTSEVVNLLTRYHDDPSGVKLLPHVPFPSERDLNQALHHPRELWPAPLIVRHPSPDIYSSGRRRILDSIGVPDNMQNENETRILIVSFGGQKFRRPGSRSPSKTPSPEMRATKNLPDVPLDLLIPPSIQHLKALNRNSAPRSVSLLAPANARPRVRRNFTMPSHRVVTPTHLFIPGAPGPIINPVSPILAGPQGSIFPPQDNVTIYSPIEEECGEQRSDYQEAAPEPPNLLPPGWIVIICGAGDDWGSKEHLPERMFIAPRNIYMPDLMVIGDVLLGKLGYGTCSEAIDSGTPFIYGRMKHSDIDSWANTYPQFPAPRSLKKWA